LTGGADEALFIIDSQTGLLSFIDPPDYETPLTASMTNDYEVEITALDNGIPQEFISQTITVSVLDLVETSPVELSVTVSANVTNVDLGDTVVFTLVVTNNGSEDAVDASLYDVIPTGFDHSTWTCVATGTAICPTSGTGEIAELVAIPNDGSILTYTVTAILSVSEYMHGPYQIFVDSNEPQFDTDLSNNSAQIMLTSFIFSNGFD
jgi:uncharacterized repeat protein (TIGR01451 family)